MIRTADYIAAWPASPFADIDLAPWLVPACAQSLILDVLSRLDSSYRVLEGVAAHRSATIESGAIIKAPAMIGPGCFLGAGSYLRGGVFLESGVKIGPGVELKSCLIFSATTIAHLNFIGDSIIGSRVNIEAGAIIANHRNETADKRILIRSNASIIDTGIEKFGALVGDGVRIGANSVVAPGALLHPGLVVPRLALIDQSPST